mmetsp:Transcript_26441/g.63069  ORF Transcript_26441/g.63069 Transcript_26441/m.63069 type:complete len:214 (+) Transcript_26441:627-1268(+)
MRNPGRGAAARLAARLLGTNSDNHARSRLQVNLHALASELGGGLQPLAGLWWLESRPRPGSHGCIPISRAAFRANAKSLGVDQNLRPSRLHEATADPRSIGVSEGESINPRLPDCGHRHVQHYLQEAEDPLPRRCLRRERQSNLRAPGVHRHDLLLPLWRGMYLRHRKPLGVLKPAELGKANFPKDLRRCAEQGRLRGAEVEVGSRIGTSSSD